MTRERKNLQSKNIKQSAIELDDLDVKRRLEDISPPATESNNKSNEVVYHLFSTISQQVKSARGNRYILVAYNYDANAILTESMENKQTRTITDTSEKMYKTFAKVGVAPHT